MIFSCRVSASTGNLFADLFTDMDQGEFILAMIVIAVVIVIIAYIEYDMRRDPERAGYVFTMIMLVVWVVIVVVKHYMCK